MTFGPVCADIVTFYTDLSIFLIFWDDQIAIMLGLYRGVLHFLESLLVVIFYIFAGVEIMAIFS